MRFIFYLPSANNVHTTYNAGMTNCDETNRITTESAGFIFRQLFDRDSYTYTYLLGDSHTMEALLIDPVFEQADRDLQVIEDLKLKLKFVLNTHVHADHVTGSGYLKRLCGFSLQSVISLASGANADIKVNHKDEIPFGNYSLQVRQTPGHTPGCVSYVFHSGKMVFTGDALLIRGCGRTDFQGGCSIALYNSVHSQLFSLPNDYLVYPAHDYKGRTCSTIGEEKTLNHRLTKPLNKFIAMMEDFAKRVPPPRILNTAVPANRVCGLWDLPDEMANIVDSAKRN